MAIELCERFGLDILRYGRRSPRTLARQSDGRPAWIPHAICLLRGSMDGRLLSRQVESSAKIENADEDVDHQSEHNHAKDEGDQRVQENYMPDWP
jgi:hypothetical protein